MASSSPHAAAPMALRLRGGMAEAYESEPEEQHDPQRPARFVGPVSRQTLECIRLPWLSDGSEPWRNLMEQMELQAALCARELSRKQAQGGGEAHPNLDLCSWGFDPCIAQRELLIEAMAEIHIIALEARATGSGERHPCFE